MYLVTALSVISGIVGILAFFFPIKWKKSLFVKIIFISIISILSIYLSYQNYKLNRIEKISKTANLLIKNKDTDFTNEGFVLACLSFMEQNKDEFPDSYSRAISIYKKYENNNNKGYESIVLSSELEGLIKGIGYFNTEEE